MTTSGYDQQHGTGYAGATGTTAGTGSTGGTGGAGDAKEQAQQVAGTAKQEGAHVASVAKQEAQSVAEQAKEQAATLMDQTRQELEAQSRVQKDRIADTLRSFTTDLEAMISGQGAASGMAGDLAREVADRTRGLARTLQEREPGELLDEVRGFARRKPGTFLLGALAAGMVVGRLSRAAKDAGSSSTGSMGTTGSMGSTGTMGGIGGGTAGTGASTLPPVPPAEAGTAAGEPLAGVSEGSIPPYTGGDATSTQQLPTTPSTPPTTGGGQYGGLS